MTQRDEMYFEPRVIDTAGRIRWFGEIYSDQAIKCHTEQTVYIRDNGRQLYIYELASDDFSEVERIEAVFKLISRIEKSRGGFRYGKKDT
ncbi:MAG: hypothetical protein LUG91_09780 [Ruminococcus sp.]|nr:hypothetical protein [Ruminococcus sp.]